LPRQISRKPILCGFYATFQQTVQSSLYKKLLFATIQSSWSNEVTVHPQLVYSRTLAGNAAALNPLGPLPRRARALLIALDGRTDIESCVARSSSAEETLSMLDFLVNAGLVVGRPLSAAVPASPAPGTEVQTGDRLKIQHTAAAPRAATPTAPQMAEISRSGHPMTFEIRSVVTMMSDFVMQHLPARSLEIVLALEGVTSMQQLASSLSGYAALISEAGEPGKAHLRELQKLVS
jgi:hypothetical protein